MDRGQCAEVIDAKAVEMSLQLLPKPPHAPVNGRAFTAKAMRARPPFLAGLRTLAVGGDAAAARTQFAEEELGAAPKLESLAAPFKLCNAESLGTAARIQYRARRAAAAIRSWQAPLSLRGRKPECFGQPPGTWLPNLETLAFNGGLPARGRPLPNSSRPPRADGARASRGRIQRPRRSAGTADSAIFEATSGSRDASDAPRRHREAAADPWRGDRRSGRWQRSGAASLADASRLAADSLFVNSPRSTHHAPPRWVCPRFSGRISTSKTGGHAPQRLQSSTIEVGDVLGGRPGAAFFSGAPWVNVGA